MQAIFWDFAAISTPQGIARPSADRKRLLRNRAWLVQLNLGQAIFQAVFRSLRHELNARRERSRPGNVLHTEGNSRNEFLDRGFWKVGGAVVRRTFRTAEPCWATRRARQAARSGRRPIQTPERIAVRGRGIRYERDPNGQGQAQDGGCCKQQKTTKYLHSGSSMTVPRSR